MKPHARRKNLYQRKIIPAMIAACGLAATLPGPGLAELADLSDIPLANSPTDAVLPNLMYILDDSGSMMWDYMPDNILQGPGSGNITMNNCKTATACSAGGCVIATANRFCRDVTSGDTGDWGEPPFFSAQFNQIYYNPDVEYSAAVNSTGGLYSTDAPPAAAWKDAYLNTGTTKNLKTTYPELYYCKSAGASTSTQFANSAVCRRNGINNIPASPDNYFLYWSNSPTNGGYPSGSSTGDGFISRVVSNTGHPYYFKISAHEYCSDTNLINCALATSNGSAPDSTFTIAAPIRYCASTADAASTAAVSGNDQTTTTAVRSAGQTQLVVSSIAGFASGESVKVVLNDGSVHQTTISNNPSGSSITLATAIPSGFSVAASAAVTNVNPKCRRAYGVNTFTVPRYGRFTRVDITSSSTTFTKNATAVRPDCGAGLTCTYAQELQNFANWYSFYRTRMTMMKSATGHAFRTIDDRYRVGFITINPGAPVQSASNAPSDIRYLPINTFDAAQKVKFYSALYAQTNHGGTPLREALSRVGRHYANVTTGINNGMSTDPIQFSCQQNFALLTSDGYWNDADALVIDKDGNQLGNHDNVVTAGVPVYVSRATGTLDGTGVIQTTSTPFLERERVLCTANNWISWATGGNTTGSSNTTQCGCVGSQKRVMQRTRTLSHDISRLEGVETSNITNVTSVSFAAITACDSYVETTTTTRSETMHQICVTNSNTTFGSLITGVASGSNTACGCGVPGNNRKKIVKRVRVLETINTITDGVTASGTTTTTGVTFTNVTVLNGVNDVSGCTSGSLTAALAAFSNSTGTSSSLISNSGNTISTAQFATSTALNPALPSNPHTGTAGGQTVSTSFAGSPNTLADVAMYYYKTDLRTSGPLAPNNVPSNSKDVAPHQHMVTFTLGLGLKGLMDYQSDYESAQTGDFAKIKAPASDCSWLPAGVTCNWPVPAANSPTTLDDLWHAAVNGRGTFYSAADPNSLADGLSGALSALKIQTAAASASATSSPNITETENFIYSSTFRTNKWDGQITAQRINSEDGNVLPAIVWEAQAPLDARVSASSDTRKIWKFDPANAGSANTNLRPFLWANLSGATASSVCSLTAEKGCFNVKGVNLSQYAGGLNVTQKAFADDGENMVNWLRGQTRWEGAATSAELVFRDREHMLGDAVNATPAYVRAPAFSFVDSVTPSYAAFQTAKAGRPGVLYIAANDGMLHAFNGEDITTPVATPGGAELWAYIPRILFPGLHKLATDSWGAGHKYLVDGSPQVMDAFQVEASAGSTTGAWKTVLVGGLNKGGRGFYALDVTDPVIDPGVPDSGPKGLWEICADSSLCALSDADIGLSFGNTVITKLPTTAGVAAANRGRWVAIFTSGINNYDGTTGDGKGHLYVRDLFTGAHIYKVSTGAGTTTTPAGFSKISAFADNFINDNTATFIYGGDLLGNLWRFDMSVDPPAVLKLAELKDGAAGKPQSITSRPELGVIENKRVVFVGTGRYYGENDLPDPATLTLPWAYQQSFYAIKDDFPAGAASGHGDIRGATLPAVLVEQTLTDFTTSRTASNNAVNWTTNLGWFVDFNPGIGAGTSPGERVNLDPQLVLGTIVVVTNVPNDSACSIGGDSFIYQFNYASGSFVASAPGEQVAVKYTAQITVGLVVVRLPSGVFKGIATGATGDKIPVGVNVGGAGGSGRRVWWRELIR